EGACQGHGEGGRAPAALPQGSGLVPDQDGPDQERDGGQEGGPGQTGQGHRQAGSGQPGGPTAVPPANQQVKPEPKEEDAEGFGQEAPGKQDGGGIGGGQETCQESDAAAGQASSRRRDQDTRQRSKPGLKVTGRPGVVR